MKTLVVWIPFAAITIVFAWWGTTITPNDFVAGLLWGIGFWFWPISGVLGTLLLWYFLPTRWGITTVWTYAFGKDPESYGFYLPTVIFGGAIFMTWLGLIAGIFSGLVDIPPQSP